MNPHTPSARQFLVAATALILAAALPCFAAETALQPVGPDGVNIKALNLRLADALTTRLQEAPRNEKLCSFSGAACTEVHVARPAIGAPFGEQKFLIDLPFLPPGIALQARNVKLK